MCSEFGVGIGCVGVRVPGGGEDCAALDAGFYQSDVLDSVYIITWKVEEMMGATYANLASSTQHASTHPNHISPLCSI